MSLIFVYFIIWQHFKTLRSFSLPHFLSYLCLYICTFLFIIFIPPHPLYSTLLQPPHLISPLFFSHKISSASLCFPLLSSSLSFLISSSSLSSLLLCFPLISSPLLPSHLFSSPHFSSPLFSLTSPLLPSSSLSSLLISFLLFQTTHLTRTSVQYEEKHPLLTWQTLARS